MGQNDFCLKRYLSDGERFADLINGIIGEGEALLVSDDLSDMDSQVGYYASTMMGKRSVQYRDLLKKAAFGVNFVVIGIEHQEHTNYLMPLRCMGYDVREYERQAAVEKSKVRRWKKIKAGCEAGRKLTQQEFLSGFLKDSKLHPCITIVLYFGERWEAPTTLHGLLDFTSIPKRIRKYVNDYNIHLVNVRRMQDTKRFQTDLRQVFDCIRFSEDKDRFYKYVMDNPEFSQLDEDAYDVITRYTNVLEGIDIKTQNDMEGGKVNMCKAMQELREDWREEGRAEGRAESVLTLLKRLGDVSEDLMRRIMKEQDKNLLTDWLMLAASAGSVQEFELGM